LTCIKAGGGSGASCVQEPPYRGSHEAFRMSNTIAVFRSPQPRIRRVPVERPWAWLVAGWDDLRANLPYSVACGLVPVAAGWLAIVLLIWLDLPYLVLPLGAGFFFVGPFLAVGLYEISRRRGIGLPLHAAGVFGAWRRNPDQLALMGALLIFVHLVWMRVAQLLFALFEWRSLPAWDRFADLLWFSSSSLPFLTVGMICGGALAVAVFAIGAFSIPYLLDRREANLFEAIATSVAAIRLNPRPMALWAALIVFLVAAGIVPGLIGLAVVVPVVGHATWHAYRDIIVFPDDADRAASANDLAL
jgi:uncharacterized membrane protein